MLFLIVMDNYTCTPDFEFLFPEAISEKRDSLSHIMLV